MTISQKASTVEGEAAMSLNIHKRWLSWKEFELKWMRMLLTSCISWPTYTQSLGSEASSSILTLYHAECYVVMKWNFRMAERLTLAVRTLYEVSGIGHGR